MFCEFEGRNGRKVIGEVVMDEVRLKRLADRMQNLDEWAFDTETNTLRVQCAGEMKLVGISICFGENDTYYIPTGHYFDEGQLSVDTVVKYLKPVFERKDVRIIIQNAKYDLHVMENIGIKIQTDDIFDTMLASWLIDENEAKGLKEMTSRKYGIAQTHFDECLNTVTKEEKKMLGLKASNKAEFWMVRIENGAPYALADAYWTWRHYVDWQLDDLEKEKMMTIYRKMFVPFLKTVYNMERRGVRVDIPKLQDMQKRAEKDLADMEYKMIEIAGVEFSPTSSQQLAELLFGYEKFNKKGEFTGNAHILAKSFNFPVISTTEGGAPQTGDYQLEQLLKQTYKKDKRKQEGLELIRILQDYKKLAKIKSAFIDGLLAQVYDDGKVHPTIGVAGADSGRVTCSNPNLNQLPRPVEFNPPMSFEEWKNANGKEIEDTLNIEEYLVIDKGYPTGEVYEEAYTYEIEPYEEYLEYLKEWRVKNEKAVFWKSYEIRDCFIPDDPEEEVVLAGDFSNLEMVMLAHFSNDERLCTTFRNGDDAHGATAVNMFNLDCTPKEVKKKYPALRQISKAINFGLMYGMGAQSLYRTLADQEATDEHGNPITKEKAQEYYDKYFETYSGVAQFIQNQKKFAHKNGYVLTICGRKRRLPAINSGDYKMEAYCERLSTNAPIQGSTADLMMLLQPKLEEHPKLKEYGCTMRMQIYDEIVFICKKKYVNEAIEIIKELAENPFPKPLNVPLKFEMDYGKTYAEAK